MSTAGEADAIPIAGSIRLPPDSRSIEALGRNHTFEAAIAELVDNSIDAGARNVIVRFVRDGSRLLRLLIVDDGVGMDGAAIDVAMTIGGTREYASDEIGRFGLGLKAASFSQARSVTVVSRGAANDAHGRRWLHEHARNDYKCEIVAPEFAYEMLRHDRGLAGSPTGTIVRWDDVKGFPAHDHPEHVDAFLQQAMATVRTHLGLIFHRILAREKVRLVVEVEEREELVVDNEVRPLDPFGYSRSGAVGWPRSIAVGRGEQSLTLNCHIWPGRSTAEEFRLDGDVQQRQGIYAYYNDRLIQRGGWNGLCHVDRQLNLARISLDVTGDVEQMLSIRPEKNGIEVGPAFAPAVLAAVADGSRLFVDYLEHARGILREANRRRRARQAILPLGVGFDPKLRRAFARELPFRDDDPVDIRWRQLKTDAFFLIDRTNSTLWLNQRYRRALLGERRGSLNDLPVVKALLFLMVENIFAGQNVGPRDRDNVDVWQEILTAAARAESV